MEVDKVVIEDGSGGEDMSDDEVEVVSAKAEAKVDMEIDAKEKIEPAYHAFTESAQAAIDKAEEVKAQFDLRSREKDLVVPTRDDLVKKRLRELGEPICLFGEIKGDRRDRLKALLLQMGITHGLPQEESVKTVDADEVSVATEAFLTEGTEQLKRAREFIAKRSLLRARRRIEQARAIFEDEALQKEEDVLLDKSIEKMKKIVLYSSHVGAERPLTAISFNNGNEKREGEGESSSLRVATGSWDGNVTIWSVPLCQSLMRYQGHQDSRVCGVDFHPRSGVDLSESAAQLATASTDKTVKLWSLDSPAPISVLKGHVDRVNRAIFHPFGRHLVSVSFDKTWRLWDLETQHELLLQEGHSKSLVAAAFQGDGSLIATGGLDSRAVVWDLRSGRSLWTVSSHVKPVLALDWSPNGYILATGSEDHTCKLIDVRMRRILYTIPAHTSVVSSVKFEPVFGAVLMSSSFDSTVNMWDAVGQNHDQLKSFAGHDGRVMGMDVARGGDYIATAGYDRTWKLFAID